MKHMILSLMLLMGSASAVANNFAEIPDFSSNRSLLMISSAKTFTPSSSGDYNGLDLGNSNGQLALVDNVNSPSCVAFLQLADTVNAATQQIIADTINLSCNN